MAAYVFFAPNNMRRTAEDAYAYAELVFSVARGETAKSAVAEFFRGNTVGA